MNKLVELVRVHPDPDQPRKNFKSSEMEELKTSIKAQGILTPLIVESNQTDDTLLILDGERRYRNAKMLGLKEIPVEIVKGPLTYEERTTLRFHIQEQHSSWSELDRAKAIYDYRRITKKTIAEIAERLNMHIPKVHAYLSVTEFTENGQKLIIEKEVPFTHLIFLIRIVKNYLVISERKQEEIEQKLIEKISLNDYTVPQVSLLSNIISAKGQDKLKMKFLEDLNYSLTNLIEETGEKNNAMLEKLYKSSMEVNDLLLDLEKRKVELSKEHVEKLYAIYKRIEKLI